MRKYLSTKTTRRLSNKLIAGRVSSLNLQLAINNSPYFTGMFGVVSRGEAYKSNLDHVPILNTKSAQDRRVLVAEQMRIKEISDCRNQFLRRLAQQKKGLNYLDYLLVLKNVSLLPSNLNFSNFLCKPKLLGPFFLSVKTISKKVRTVFDEAVCVENLLAVWCALVGGIGLSVSRCSTLNISRSWFEKLSLALKQGFFEYPKQQCELNSNLDLSVASSPKSAFLASFKVVECIFLRALEPYYEGLWRWEKISSEEYVRLKNSGVVKNSSLKECSAGIFRKNWIFLKVFLNNSFGFRPGRSAQDALLAIKHWDPSVVWFLDYSVTGAFAGISKNRLINLLDSRTLDPRFGMQVRKMLNAGTLSAEIKDFTKFNTEKLSSLGMFLVNVYMHELDKFILNLKCRVETCSCFRRSKLMSKKCVPIQVRRCKRLRMGYKSSSRYCTKCGCGGVRLQYIRYATSFMLGIGGSRALVLEIHNQINTFIKSDLHLFLQKNDLVHRAQGPILFLGHLVQSIELSSKTRKQFSCLEATKRLKRRTLARLDFTDKRLARVQINDMRRRLVAAYRTVYEKYGLSWSNTAVRDVAAQVIAKKQLITTLTNLLQNVKADCTNQEFLVKCCGDIKPVKNLALRRWEGYMGRECDFNSRLLIKFWKGAFLGLAVPGKCATVTSDILRTRSRIVRLAEGLCEKYKVRSCVPKSIFVQKRFKKSRLRALVWSKASSNLFSRLGSGNTFFSMFRNRKIVILVPIGEIKRQLTEAGFWHPKEPKAVHNARLIALSDIGIITIYRRLIVSLLRCFIFADNLSRIGGILITLKKSCILTLCRKHRKSKSWVYSVYGDNVVLRHPITNRIMANLPSIHGVHVREKKRNSLGFAFFNLKEALGSYYKVFY